MSENYCDSSCATPRFQAAPKAGPATEAAKPGFQVQAGTGKLKDLANVLEGFP